MYSNQQPPIYTTRHYIHEPSSNSRSNSGTSYIPPRPAQPYPYYSNDQPPTTVTYLNDRPNYGQPPMSYGPSSATNYAPSNSASYAPVTRSNSNYARSNSGAGGGGGGGIEKSNMMSNQNPFVDPARPYEQQNSGRTITSITAQPKSGGLNKSLNLSEENPFHTVYGGYQYSSQIDPSKRITTQAAAVRSTDNKSLNLSDENPFFSTYGRYHYPSQIDPQKRITEIPKAAGQFLATNDMSNENPFSNYRPTTIREYSGGGGGGGGNGGGSTSFPSSIADWSRNNPAPLSYRPIQVQAPPPPASTFRYRQDEPSTNFSNAPSPMRPPSPPRQQQPPPRVQAQQPPSPQKSASSAPPDKMSLNMSPDNPFASSFGHYHYPSPEEIKAQKRASERNVRFAEQQPAPAPGGNRSQPPSQTGSQMTEYPETNQNKDVVQGKGNTKFTRFDVTF